MGPVRAHPSPCPGPSRGPSPGPAPSWLLGVTCPGKSQSAARTLSWLEPAEPKATFLGEGSPTLEGRGSHYRPRGDGDRLSQQGVKVAFSLFSLPTSPSPPLHFDGWLARPGTRGPLSSRSPPPPTAGERLPGTSSFRPRGHGSGVRDGRRRGEGDPARLPGGGKRGRRSPRGARRTRGWDAPMRAHPSINQRGRPPPASQPAAGKPRAD